MLGARRSKSDCRKVPDHGRDTPQPDDSVRRRRRAGTRQGGSRDTLSAARVTMKNFARLVTIRLALSVSVRALHRLRGDGRALLLHRARARSCRCSRSSSTARTPSAGSSTKIDRSRSGSSSSTPRPTRSADAARRRDRRPARLRELTAHFRDLDDELDRVERATPRPAAAVDLPDLKGLYRAVRPARSRPRSRP